MASNLSTIGFAFDDDQEFRIAIERLAADAIERLHCAAGEYAIWRSRSGAELWFHLALEPAASGERDIIGFTPFHEGQSEIAVHIESRVVRPEDNALEGAFHAWVVAEGGEDAYPLVFDAVDAAAHADLELPATVNARITGFARELKAFASVDAFHIAHADTPSLAAQSFLPLGLFAEALSDDSETEAPPQSTALLTGRVAEHALLTNEETGRRFHWLLVDSHEASFDVIADPETVVGEIAVGGTIETTCWLVGRLLA